MREGEGLGAVVLCDIAFEENCLAGVEDLVAMSRFLFH